MLFLFGAGQQACMYEEELVDGKTVPRVEFASKKNQTLCQILHVKTH